MPAAVRAYVDRGAFVPGSAGSGETGPEGSGLGRMTGPVLGASPMTSAARNPT